MAELFVTSTFIESGMEGIRSLLIPSSLHSSAMRLATWFRHLLITDIATFISCLLFGFLIVSLLAHRNQRRELKKLRSGIRSIVRREAPANRISFSNRLLDELWHQVVALASRTRSVEATKSTFDEVISLGSRIAGMSDEVSATAEEVVAVLHSRTQPEVCAAAVLLRDVKSGELKITALRGIPESRLSNALLMSFDALFSNDCGQHPSEGPASWGYQVPKRGSLFDFSVFGIGLSLTLPLRDQNGICGGLWLGFREGASTLTPQRKALVQAIAEHTAATFYASRKFTEKKRESESERDFLLGMSHDLRAPGNSALYALRDLLSGELGPLSEEQHVRLSIIERSLEDQLGILGDVLDYAKHQKGFLEANTQVVDINLMIKRLLDTFQLSAAQKNLKLSSDPIPDLSLIFDPRHLQRILCNFLSNAIKYTDQGAITITFRTECERLEIGIRDTGIGVPTEGREELFSEFKRFRNVGNRQGVGLGLALSKALAEINHGYVYYEPSSDKQGRVVGSIFGVGAPIATATAGIYRPESSVPIRVYLRSILVIDDDPAVCRLNVRYLKELADSVVPASSMEEALELAREIRPELIVTDLNVGNAKAPELLKRLAAINVLAPVIVITGSASPKESRELAALYKAIILEKPVGRELLYRTVSDLFRLVPVAAANS